MKRAAKTEQRSFRCLHCHRDFPSKYARKVHPCTSADAAGGEA